MNWAVVMAGGRGTRFWPQSRARHPKPFLKLLGRRTILEETAARLKPLFPPERILIVIQSDLVRTARLLPWRIPRENILGEPVGRNTAPCAVYAAGVIARRDPDAKLVFLPADQFIRPKSLFLKSLETALRVADERPVLLGMRPDSPSPAYGYLEAGPRKKKVNGISLYTVRRFHEKPSPARAGQFLKRGNFFWNGGIFVWRLAAFEQAIQKYLPRVYRVWGRLADAGAAPRGRPNRGQARGPAPTLQSIYKTLPSISLDYGVMEKMRNVHCLESPFEWSDLGGWEGLAEFWPKDSGKNRIKGNALLVKSEGNIVKAGDRLVALVGVKDLLVVDTADALLICPRSETEKIRDVVRELEKRKAFKYL